MSLGRAKSCQACFRRFLTDVRAGWQQDADLLPVSATAAKGPDHRHAAGFAITGSDRQGAGWAAACLEACRASSTGTGAAQRIVSIRGMVHPAFQANGLRLILGIWVVLHGQHRKRLPGQGRRTYKVPEKRHRPTGMHEKQALALLERPLSDQNDQRASPLTEETGSSGMVSGAANSLIA